MRRFELLNDHTFGISFPYNENAIGKIKRIPGRRWNPSQKRWEIPLSHLKDVLEIFGADMKYLPEDLRKAFEENWGGDVDARITMGNCFTQLAGRNLPMEAIEEVTSFWIEGAEHTDRYKKGQWDGRKRLMKKKKTLEFPTGLLPQVLHVLRRAKLKHWISDQRQLPEPSLKLKTKGVRLRPYQKETIQKAVEAKRGVLQMATGAGKTVVAGAIIAKLGQPALFFVHTKDLLYQAKSYFEQMLGEPIGQIGDGVVDIKPIVVATIQTTSRALGIKIPKEELREVAEEKEIETARDQVEAIQKKILSTPLVFFDECHHLPASTCYNIAMKTEAAYYRFGLSATPYRSDRQDLMIEAAVGPKIVSIDCSYLIEKGYLVKPKIYFMPVPSTLVTRRYIRYPAVYKSEVVENDFRNQLVAELAGRFSEQGQRVLVLVAQVKHGKNIAALLPEAVLLTGQDSSDFRTTTLDQLRSGEQKIVIATTLADEGLDIPALEVLILAGAGKSETRALQRIGRALRKTKEKKEATIIDFYDKARFLEVHSRRRFEIYETERRFDIRMEDDFQDPSAGSKDLFEDIVRSPR